MIPAIINREPATLCTLSSVFTVSFLIIQCALCTLSTSIIMNVARIDPRNTQIISGDIWWWCLRIKCDSTVTQKTNIDGFTRFMKNHLAATVRLPICHIEESILILTSFDVSFLSSNITQYTQKTTAPITHIICDGHQSHWLQRINPL